MGGRVGWLYHVLQEGGGEGGGGETGGTGCGGWARGRGAGVWHHVLQEGGSEVVKRDVGSQGGPGVGGGVLLCNCAGWRVEDDGAGGAEGCWVLHSQYCASHTPAEDLPLHSAASDAGPAAAAAAAQPSQSGGCAEHSGRAVLWHRVCGEPHLLRLLLLVTS